MTAVAQRASREETRTTWRNVAALTGDFFLFSIGFAFYDPLVVVPAFVSEFSGSGLLIGVLSALRVLMITVPQIWAASVLEARPRMKPLLVGSSIGGRIPVLLLAIAVFFWAPAHIGWVITILAISVMLFYTSEGLNGVSWPALVGKVVPEGYRGRFYGTGQLLSSLGALAAGLLVNRVLGLEALAPATRWSVLFVCAFIGLMLSVASMAFIREKPEVPKSDRVDVRESLRKMWQYLREDRWLRRVIIVQLVLATPSATFAFFVVRARQVLPGAESMVGTFLMLQSVGSAIVALAGGILIDRVGSWAAIRLAAVAEVLALVAAAVAGLGTYPLVLYALAFFLMGFVNGSSWWSFSAYMLDMAPADRRPIYLATNGVLVSVTALNPVIAGGLIEALRPEAVFGSAAILALLGLGFAWTLRKGVGTTSAVAET